MILLSSSLFLQGGFTHHEHRAHDDSTISEADRKRCERHVLKTKSEACKQLAAYLEGHNPNAQLTSTNLSDGRPAIKLTYQVKRKDNYGVYWSDVESNDLLAVFKLCVESTPELAQKLEQEIENLQPKS